MARTAQCALLIAPYGPAAPRSSTLERLHTFAGAEQQQVGRACGEQTIADYADDVVDLRFRLRRVADHQVVYVEDDVAVVGLHAFAVDRVAAQLDQLAGRVAARH